jgi:hypothetical protein
MRRRGGPLRATDFALVTSVDVSDARNALIQNCIGVSHRSAQRQGLVTSCKRRLAMNNVAKALREGSLFRSCPPIMARALRLRRLPTGSLSGLKRTRSGITVASAAIAGLRRVNSAHSPSRRLASAVAAIGRNGLRLSCYGLIGSPYSR